MKYVDASGQGLSTQMGQGDFRWKPGNAVCAKRTFKGLLFSSYGGLTLEDGRGTGTFSASAGLARFQI